MPLKLSKGYSYRGADMGRRNFCQVVESGARLKLHLQRLQLDSGGYDKGGAYWGHPNDIFVAWSEDPRVFMTIRATSRAKAKASFESSPLILNAKLVWFR